MHHLGRQIFLNALLVARAGNPEADFVAVIIRTEIQNLTGAISLKGIGFHKRAAIIREDAQVVD